MPGSGGPPLVLYRKKRPPDLFIGVISLSRRRACDNARRARTFRP